MRIFKFPEECEKYSISQIYLITEHFLPEHLSKLIYLFKKKKKTRLEHHVCEGVEERMKMK